MSLDFMTTTQTLYRVDWCWPAGKKDGRAAVPIVKPREIHFRPRRGVWDCLPLDTFEDLDAAAREWWFPTPEAAIAHSLAREQEEVETGQRRVAALKAAARARKRAP